MYYCNLDDDGYVLSISVGDNGNGAELESLDGLDLSGVRLMAHRYADGRLTLDEARLSKLLEEQAARERERRRPNDRDVALAELAGMLAENTVALAELAAMIGGDA